MKIDYWLSRIIVYYIIVLTILRIGLVPFIQYFPQSIFFAEVTSTSLLELVNESRDESGLAPLTLNDQLNLAAYQKAQDMINNQYFAHHSPAGITPWHWFGQAGYRYQYAGENLAIHFFDSAKVHQAWMDSPTHRANILGSSYREMGLAVVQGEMEGQQTTIVVQLFGSPYQIQYAEAPYREPGVEREVVLAEEFPVETVEVDEPETETIVLGPTLPDLGPRRAELVSGEADLRLLGTSSVGLVSGSDSYWFRIFKAVSRSYESLIQQMIFYGLILVALYLLSVSIFKPKQQASEFCARTALFVLLLMLLAFSTKELIVQWVVPQIIIG
jgi:hypothetical protein